MIRIFIRNLTSGNEKLTNKIDNPLRYKGVFNMDIFDSTLNVLNSTTYIDRQEIIEAVRLADFKYGKAFDKLAEQ